MNRSFFEQYEDPDRGCPRTSTRDEELMVPVAAFQKAGIPYDIASTRRGPFHGMLGAKTTATLSFGEVKSKPSMEQ